MRRILVGSAPVRLSPDAKPARVPAEVGVILWRGEGSDFVTVIVRATTSYREGQLSFVEPRPWVANGEIKGRANDFVPAKSRCDVLLQGHVDILGGEPQQVIVRAADASLAFTLASSGPGRVPLAPPYLTVAGDGSSDVGPSAKQHDPSAEGFFFDRGFDYSAFQAAHTRLQSGRFPNGTPVSIEGLNPAGPLIIPLPDFGARALVEWTRQGDPSDLDLRLDTVHIDLDAETADLVWRGWVSTPRDPRKHIDRILVGFASDADFDGIETDKPEERFRSALRELPRGKFEYAWEREDVLEGKSPPALPHEELEMARYEALAGASAPSPTLTLEAHALMTAKLLEIPFGKEGSVNHGEERAELLRANGFDEYGWSLEERAHIDRLAVVPEDAEGGTHGAYGAMFVSAQDSLAPIGESLPNAKDYAAILTRLQVERPNEVLADAKLSLGAWMRIERRWQSRMVDDPKAAREVEGYLAEQSRERGEPKIPEFDDEGRQVQ